MPDGPSLMLTGELCIAVTVGLIHEKYTLPLLSVQCTVLAAALQDYKIVFAIFRDIVCPLSDVRQVGVVTINHFLREENFFGARMGFELTTAGLPVNRFTTRLF